MLCAKYILYCEVFEINLFSCILYMFHYFIILYPIYACVCIKQENSTLFIKKIIFFEIGLLKINQLRKKW